MSHPVAIKLMLRPSKISIDATLHPPTSIEYECPILQEAITSANFDIMPRPFDLNHPTHTAITLGQCSHTFHAMALIYHWARSDGVLCPVCRAGPKGQRLSIRRLPGEWRYSLAARVRRQKHKDRKEAEEDDRQTALQMAANQHVHPIILSISPMYIEIRIEVLSRVNLNDLDTPLPYNWNMSTNPTRQPGFIIFDVPTEELDFIPYPIGTRMRMVPQTNRLLQPLQPSRWFTAGMDAYPGDNFIVQCDEHGFRQIRYTLSDILYEELMLDAFMAYDVLVAVS